MRSIGVRDLKAHLRAILRQVQREGAGIEITQHGVPIALLIPIPRPQVADSDSAIWARLDQLTVEIGHAWPPGVSAVDAVREVRRDL